MLPITGVAMKLNDLAKLSSSFAETPAMPVLFLGHGNPMNAIQENEFVEGFRKIARTIPRPNAIVCVSAHWETRGTLVTAMPQPKTIHDFGGFPPELYQVQYPAPGSPALAGEIQSLVKSTSVGLNNDWGLDHGAWSVIRHLYPKADVPVIQLSIDYTQSPRYHYELGRALSALRRRGILIIGSGNLVHNLRMVDWRRMNESGYGFDWALEAREKMNKFITEGNHQALIDFAKQGRSFQLAIPTPEHFLPLLYTLGLKAKGESVTIFNDKPIAGSLTMTSLKIGG